MKALLTPIALACTLAAGTAYAAPPLDLVQTWQAVRAHDPQMAVAQASLAAAETSTAQAKALWRPTVTLGATLSAMNADTSANGASFSAPGFGSTNGVDFNTAVHGGFGSKWVLQAKQALFNAEKSAQAKQLHTAARLAALQWQQTQQALMLRTAQRYLELGLAEQKLALLQEQRGAAEQALAEAKDRFALGDIPVTGTHEANASAQSLQAQLIASQGELAFARASLADSTGWPEAKVQVRHIATSTSLAPPPALEQALQTSQQRNPAVLMRLAQVEMADEEVQKNSASRLATLDLVAQASDDHLSGHGVTGSASNGARQQMVGIQFNLPLYTGGWRSAKQAEALDRLDAANAQVDATRQDIRDQTRQAWIGLQTAQARLQALQAAVQASTLRLDATRLGRRVGDRNTLDVLNAANDNRANEFALLQARADALLNYLRLDALMGQLDDKALTAVNAQLTP